MTGAVPHSRPMSSFSQPASPGAEQINPATDEGESEVHGAGVRSISAAAGLHAPLDFLPPPPLIRESGSGEREEGTKITARKNVSGCASDESQKWLASSATFWRTS